MKAKIFVSLLIGSALFASAANAQLADKRSFFWGFWSNDYYVAQKEIYPRFHYAPRDVLTADPSSGGWILHERNW